MVVIPVHCKECNGTGRNGTLCRSALLCASCNGDGGTVRDFAGGPQPPFTQVWVWDKLGVDTSKPLT